MALGPPGAALRHPEACHRSLHQGVCVCLSVCVCVCVLIYTYTQIDDNADPFEQESKIEPQLAFHRGNWRVYEYTHRVRPPSPWCRMNGSTPTTQRSKNEAFQNANTCNVNEGSVGNAPLVSSVITQSLAPFDTYSQTDKTDNRAPLLAPVA